MQLNHIVDRLRAAPAWRRKRDLDVLARDLLQQTPLVEGQPVALGDDAAAIPTDDGYLLLAAEVVYPDLVVADPRLAGRSAILANVNDIYAMGGTPLAVIDTILAPNTEAATEIVCGLKEGCARYGVALVGGHLTAAGDVTSVAVSILGRAQRLLSSLNVRPGDTLLYATRLQGTFHPDFPFWNCSAHRSDEELRHDLAILPQLAEAGWCDAARDISMAGLLGSLMMMLEPSGVGAVVDMEAIPQPDAAADRYLDWLLHFPSYGFVLAARPQHAPEVQDAFAARGVTCAVIGEATSSRNVLLHRRGEEALLWDFSTESFTGFFPHPSERPMSKDAKEY